MNRKNIYCSIIEAVFLAKFKTGTREVDFEREDIVRYGDKLKVPLPKNLGDLVYSFRYRSALPDRIRRTAKEGESWIIRAVGKSKYRFVLVPDRPLIPNTSMAATKVPDSTPGVVIKYAFSDEQALLAILRYNRLVDIFTGVACYSLQSHLRTTVPAMGQVETDEVYIGIDKRGIHYILPVQAKSAGRKLSVVQIEQDLAMCAAKFPSLVCRPIGAQFVPDATVALFEFEQGEQGVAIITEKHYRLVPPEDVTEEDLSAYQRRTSE